MSLGVCRLFLNRISTTKSAHFSISQTRSFSGSFVLWRNRKMTKEIEKIYQKVSQLEHVLLRPDTYVGSVEYIEKTPMWVYDAEEDKIVWREVSYVPGLYKIFDEILVNAADNKQRDKRMTTIKININKEKNEISIYNNGKGVPIAMHKTEHMYVPELIFGTLLTSSNYNDDDRKVTGGRNGYGAKLCNIFSTKFTLETQDNKKYFKQTWVNNMKKDGEPFIGEPKGSEDFTKVTFTPDLKKFKMDKLDDDIIALMSRRAYDVAGSVPGIKVYLNNKLLPCKGFKEYVEQYTKNRDNDGEPLKVAFDRPHERWEIALTVSNMGFQQVSFVNSIATNKGGRHVDYVVDQITSSLIETIKKKIGKGGINIKPFQLKNHLWIFVNSLIENPTFDSQTKDTMTLQHKDFGSKFKLSDRFLKEIATKCGIVDSVMSWVRFKQMEQQDKKCSSKKTSKLKGIPKLEDANDAGTKNSHLCTLILTEGDSAKSLAVAGLGVVGRDRYGVFPLRGKMLNVRECKHKQIVDNAEINALLRIIGLQYKMKYTTDEEMKTLRYGKLMIMTDQDQDGSHIKGLVINFIHTNWPHLLRNKFIEEFITPIVKATKGTNISRSFYSLPEYMEWRQNTDDWKSYKIKYYKGLGTSSAKEAKEYFTDIERHRIKFQYSGTADDDAVELAFSKKKIEERKTWLTEWMNIRKARREQGQFEDYLYEPNSRSITFSDFINKELVLFSNTDNERSIPSLIDGLKPGQRKVLFTCFKRADKKEVKVAQLAGAVGEMSAYHHGETSLMGTIINLAQDFVGSNNINLLLPNGQFGTRLQGGKDAASARYIFTQLNPITKALFSSADEHVLRFLYEENQRIEPEWYCPIIPTVLVNGAEGIGTGWSTKVPNYNPRDIIENIRLLIEGKEQKTLVPWFKKFKGSIVKLDETRYVCSGEVATLNDETIEITELPVKTWTQTYKDNVLETMLEGTSEKATITDYKEYHTEETVKFVVKMKSDQLSRYEREGLHKAFKLQTIINTSSMVLFDADGVLRKFNTPEEICQEFFVTRKRVYEERKAYLQGMLQAQSDRLTEQARFILKKINGELQIENKKKAAIIDQLIENNFKPDPVKIWKEKQRKKELETCGDAANDEEEDELPEAANDNDKRVANFDYLVGMAIWKLSTEDKDKLLKESAAKRAELETLMKKDWDDLWEEDLKTLEQALADKEARDKKELDDCLRKAAEKLSKGADKGGRKNDKRMSKGMIDVLPSRDALRVVPTLDGIKEKYEAKSKKEKDPNAPPKTRKPREPKDSSKPKQPRKKKQSEANGSMDDFVERDEDEGSTQMTNDDTPSESRKRKSTDSKKPKEKAAKRAPKEKATKTTPKKKKAKKDWESDSSEESMSESVSDDEEMSQPLPKREVARRAAATKKATYKLDDDEEEDQVSSESDTDTIPKTNDFVERDEDEGSTQMTNGTNDDSPKENRKQKLAEKKPKEKATKRAPKEKATKTTPKKKKAKKDSDASEESMPDNDSDEDLINESPPKREATSRRAATNKKASYKVDEDSDGSDKEVASKTKARRVIYSDEEEY